MNLLVVIRTSLGFSQEYVASRLNISQQNYSQLEKKPEKLTIQRLEQLAQIFNVDVSQLLPSKKENIPLENIDFKKLFPDIYLQKDAYENQINELKEEIEFLKNIVRSYTDSPK